MGTCDFRRREEGVTREEVVETEDQWPSQYKGATERTRRPLLARMTRNGSEACSAMSIRNTSAVCHGFGFDHPSRDVTRRYMHETMHQRLV